MPGARRFGGRWIEPSCQMQYMELYSYHAKAMPTAAQQSTESKDSYDIGKDLASVQGYGGA